MVPKFVALISVVVSSVALAQTTPDFSPPPMVPATPPPTPPPEPGSGLVQPGTPPPPSLAPPPGYLPGQPPTGYPYSPYGTPQGKDAKPPLEWGLMISESLFGMLTSAGITLIPYFLLLRPMVLPPSAGSGPIISDAAAATVVFCLIFAAVPLAVSQTQLSLANGSRHYFSEAWPAALAGLAGEGLVLGIFFLAAPRAPNTFPMQGGSEGWLLVGSIALVPLIQMAVINLTKTPRLGRIAALTRDEKGAVAFGLPTIAPWVGAGRSGASVGIQAQLLNLQF